MRRAKESSTFIFSLYLFHRDSKVEVPFSILQGIGQGQAKVMASIMRNANRLQKALDASSGTSFGAWQMLPGSNLSRVIARAGFDWVCVDCEHGNIAGSIFSPRPCFTV